MLSESHKVHKVRVDGWVKNTSNVDMGEHCLLLFCIQSLIRKMMYKLTVQTHIYGSCKRTSSGCRIYHGSKEEKTKVC